MARSRSVAEEYHLLTKYTPESVRGGPGLNWDAQPSPMKEIVSRQRVSLKPYHLLEEAGVSEPFADTGADGTAFGLAQLARLLLHTYGVTGLLKLPDGRSHPLRAAPSAGALYPAEAYVAVRDLPELEPGLYHYQGHAHELVPMWPGDQLDSVKSTCFESAALRDVRACVLLTGLFWRSAWRYRERGYRRVLLDTGHVLGNLCAYAPYESCAAIPIFGFLDDAVNGLFFFDDKVEAVLACVPILEEVTGSVPEPLIASPTTRVDVLPDRSIEDEEALAKSATLLLHRASGCLEDAHATAAPGSEPPVSDLSIAATLGASRATDLPRAILTRRSARGYAPGAIDFEDLSRILAYTFGRGDEHGAGRPVRFATRDAGLLHARLIVNGVRDLDPGIYAIEGAGEALLSTSLGDFRERAHAISLGQEIARDCCAILSLHAPSKASVARYGDRAYRYLHLEAGHVGERFQLAATALNLAACGVGGFFDNEAAALLGISEEDWVLYLVTLGLPMR